MEILACKGIMQYFCELETDLFTKERIFEAFLGGKKYQKVITTLALTGLCINDLE